MMGKRKFIDWDSIEPLYRVGVLSLNNICAQYEADHVNSQVWKKTVHHTAIIKRAKAKGWTRNLANKVKECIKESLVTSSVRGCDQTGLTDQQIIEEAAKKPTEVRLLQRTRVLRIADIGDKLQVKLETDLKKKRSKTLTLFSMVTNYDKLVTARMRLQQMESNAFGLDEIGSEDGTKRIKVSHIVEEITD